MIRFYYLIFIILPIVFISTSAQQGMMSSYEGRHFYVGFLDNEVYFYWDPNMSIYLSSKYNTDVTITDPILNKTYTVNIKKDEIVPIDVAMGYEHLISEEVSRNKLIEIKSEFPISCIAKSSMPQSSDEFSIIPIRNWGKDYYAVTMPNDFYYEPPGTDATKVEMEKTTRHGEFLIMASEDNTIVNIKLADDSFKENPKDTTINVILNKGESYLVKSRDSHGVKGVYDLSGTHVTSNKPIGFISGHMRTSIAQQDEYNQLDSKDHIVEMLPPTNAWSDEYISLPFGNGIGSMFKVIAKDTINLAIDNSLNSNLVQMLPGEVMEFNNITVATHWKANGPFLLTQFMSKSIVTLMTENYDPSMVVVPPLNKMVSKTTYFASNDVYAYSGGEFIIQYENQAVLLLANEKAKSNLKVNGKNIDQLLGFNEFSIGTSEKYYWQKVFVPQDPSIVRITCDSGAFNAIAMGNGDFDSYAMTVGASLFDEGLEDKQAPIVEFNESCSAIRGFAFDSMKTKFSGINVANVGDSTYNFTWDITPITDTTTYIEITGNVIDKNQNAYFEVTVYDYFGNARTYTYYRPGALIVLQDSIDFREINISKDSCISFSLKTGADSVLLESVDLPKDLRLNLILPFTLPKMLYKDQNYNISLCLNNVDENYKAILDSIFFNFECDYTERIDVNATIISYKLAVKNLDLPKILGGTTYYTSASEYVEFINEGNASIVADSIILPLSAYFTVDTTGLFPDTLEAGESIKFNNISFTHSVAGTYNYIVTLMDNKGINRQATITGHIGTPEINNIYCDFGGTRIGTQKDTVLSFINSGTFLSRFTLAEPIISNIANDPNVTTLMALDTVVIEEAKSKDLNFTYNPTDINDRTPYKLVAKFVERWTPHDTITVTLLGQPTLPEIETYYIDLDTVKISRYKDSTVKVISSLGNEILSIKKITKLSGDENIFEFDKSFYNPHQIAINKDDSLAIRFNGISLGRHNMWLIVESDATPSFGTKIDSIFITGFVEKEDTLDVVGFAEDIQVMSCHYDTLNLQITNTGNTNIRVDKVEITTTLSTVRLVDNNMGDTLSPSETLNKPVLVFASGDQTETIIYKIFVHDLKHNKDSVFLAESQLTSTQSKVMINPFGVETLQVGSYFKLKFSGSFPYTIDTIADIDLSLKFDIYNFYIDDPNTTMRFYDRNGDLIKEIKIKVVKVNDIFHFVSDELSNFDFTNVASWEFDLRFLTLLNNDLTGNVQLVFNLSDCYGDNSLEGILNVDEFCIYNLRDVEFSSYISEIHLDKNIISNNMDITVDATGELSGSIYAIDILGKKFPIVEKILFDKGKNNIILNFSNYANGKYILVIESNSSILTKQFIITK